MIIENNEPKTFAVILNGPPGCGKDLAARSICEFSPKFFAHREFKQKLFSIVKTLYDVDDVTFNKLYNDPKTKESPSELFNGLSPREAMIFTSEDIVKPAFGKSYFGDSASKNLAVGKINIFSDGGFDEEVIPVCDKITSDHCMIIRIKRPGKSFNNDSRRYLDLPGIYTVDLENNVTKEDFVTLVLHTILERMNSLGVEFDVTPDQFYLNLEN